MRRGTLLIALLLVALFAPALAHADFFATTAVQTHRGTHLDDENEYQGFGVFEKNEGLGQTSTTTFYDFVDDVVLGPPPGIPIREESAYASANLVTADLRASASGARRSGVFAISRALAAIKDRVVVGRAGGPPFGTLNNDVVTFTLTIDGTIAIDNPTPGSAFNNSIVALVVGKPGSITPALAFQSPDYLCSFYYGLGADAAVNYFNGPFLQSLPLVTKLTAFPATVTATCPVGGDFDWAIYIRPSYAANAVDTFWDFDFASTLEYGVSIANGGFIDSTDSGEIPPEGLPAPTVPLDHFLSYKTKTTKGSTCAPDSPGNKNKACTTEEDCDGVTDDTTYCMPDKFPKGLRVTLSDRLEPGGRLYDVKKPLTLCTPAQKYDEAVHDASTHLRGYAITLTAKQCIASSPGNAGAACTKEADCGGGATTAFCQTQAKSVKQPGVTVSNQFHSGEGGSPLVVDVNKPDRLLVPTSKGLTDPLDPPGAVDVDHYKCYKVAMPKGVKFTPITGVEVQDQFTLVQPPLGKKLFDLKKPTHLCMVATKNAEGVVNPTKNLLCYQAVPTKGQPKHQAVPGLYLSNQFDTEQADTVKEEEFCVPSEVDLPAVS